MKKSNISNTGKKIILSRPVVLLGMMGAGKSSVGSALARLIGVSFSDADTEIEAAAGRSIAQIFADYGEAEFRRLERQVIARLLKTGSGVLSLGGGAFINDETRARVKESAFSVWLKVDRSLLWERVARNSHRPMLKNADPKMRIEQLLAEREPFYQQADLTVICDDRPVAQTAQKVWDAVQEHMHLP